LAIKKKYNRNRRVGLCVLWICIKSSFSFFADQLSTYVILLTPFFFCTGTVKNRYYNKTQRRDIDHLF
jgi:hypothetical protein